MGCGVAKPGFSKSEVVGLVLVEESLEFGLFFGVVDGAYIDM